ncbi:hypothetical protein SAMN04488120_10334 [Fontimonas thermophila]|uniref:Lipoprotein n=1 Tax=Fontimonas thermophila TaxID=1076937 RepID=A0A1I2I9U5_9GAMM|nr:hypothetical protein [Fontimonas thermophila]SFF37331.1 hypothetical protein SAMN04488120_10334 [Fontimonas thermophila]
MSRRLAGICAALWLSACATDPDAITSLPPCRGHCSTHTDGYEWAQRGRLSDPRACAGYTEDFERGCRDGIEDLQQLQPASRGI